MRRLVQFLILGAITAALVWCGFRLFPGPERVIRKRMSRLQELASFSPEQGNLAKGANLLEVSSFFTTNITIHVEAPGFEPVQIAGKEELMEHVRGALLSGVSLEVRFLDVTVTLSQDRTSAIVEATVRASRAGERDFFIDDLRFHFLKTDQGWLIARIESVQTLRRMLRQGEGPQRHVLPA